MSAPEMSHAIELSALDGTNPLGFLAALGTLIAARRAGESAAALGWRRSRTWTPVLHGLSTDDREDLCARLAHELRGKEVSGGADTRRNAAFSAYQQARTAVKKERDRIKAEKLNGQERRAALEARVGPLEREAADRRREWLAALKDAVPRPELALGTRIDCTGGEYRKHARELVESLDSPSRETVDLLAAFGSDACLEDGKGGRTERPIQPTPFCFIRGSGNQEFLDTVRKLLAVVTAERVAEALFEPWVYRDPGLSMRWDPSEDRRYALSDVKPADDGVQTVWMPNLLAYRALALFPSAPTLGGLGVTGWASTAGGLVFTWPLWEFAAAPDTVLTLLQLKDLHGNRPGDRLGARGIAALFRARRVRFPPTGSSHKLNFSPARQIWP